AWGEGGYYGRIFLNVAGREPEGKVERADYDSVRDELIDKLEALGDEDGKPIGTRVYKPDDLYARVENIPPDLIAIFGDLHWRSVGTVGWGAVHVHENDTGPDDANHAQHGMLVAHNVPGLSGELDDRHLTQIAATILDGLGERVPAELGPTIASAYGDR
ncbi:MAG: phosphodiesterase, partial [Salinibacter sp.]